MNIEKLDWEELSWDEKKEEIRLISNRIENKVKKFNKKWELLNSHNKRKSAKVNYNLC